MYPSECGYTARTHLFINTLTLYIDVAVGWQMAYTNVILILYTYQ